MSFWTRVLRPVVKVVAAVVAAYTGNYALAATLLSSGVADHQKQRASRKARAAYNDAQRDRQQMVASATNPRQDVYGTCVVSGTVLFKHSAGPKKEFLYIAVELARHEIDAIESVWIGEQEIPSTLWDAQGWVTGGPFNKGTVTLATVSRTGPGTIAAPQGVYRLVSAIRARSDGPVDVLSLVSASGTTITVSGAAHTDTVTVTYEWTQGRPMVRILPALGSPTQSAFAAWQTEIGDKWTSAHRLRGRAAVGLRLEYDQDVFGQMRDINIRAKVRGKKLYDPRTGLTVHSNNSALITADVLRTRMRVTAAQIPDAELAAEATRCDELVATDLAGGTQRRYTCDIAISTAVAPRDSLDLVTETMAGTVVWVQGRWLIQCGAWREPTITLTAADLAEGPRHIVPKAQRTSLTNAVVATYTEPALNWISTPAPEVTSPFYLAQDGGLSMPTQISLEGVTDSVRAQRLAKIELERARNGGTFTARWSANAYDCVPGQTIYSQISRYTGEAPKAYTVVDRKLDLRSLEIDLTLRETAAAVWDWNGGMPTLVDLTPNTDLPNPLAVPASLAITNIESGNSTLLQLSDGTILARVRLSWIQHSSAFVTQGGYIEIEWSRVGDTTWITTPQIPGDATTALVGPIDDQSAVLIRIRAINAAGRASAWLNTSHIVAGKSAPPTAPTALAATEAVGGQRIYALAHTPDIDHAGYLVRYSASLVASFAGMTDVAAEWSGVGRVGQSSFPPDGTWLFAAVAVDSSGNYSEPVYTTATLSAVGQIGAGTAGGNMVTNSDFSLGLAGWIVSPATAAPIAYAGTERARQPVGPLVPDGVDALVIGQGAPIAGGHLTAYGVAYPVDKAPVRAGERWECSMLYAAHACWVQLILEWHDAAGNVIANAYTNGGAVGGGVSLDGWAPLVLVQDVPDGAAAARLVVVKLNTVAGQTESFGWALMPQLKRANAGQTTASPYSTGPSAYYGDADATRGAPAGTLVGGTLAQNVESISGAQAKADAAHAAAILAAEQYTDYQAALLEVTANAYADGIVSAEEARAIADATAKANAARIAAEAAAAADATAKANVAATTALWSGVSGVSVQTGQIQPGAATQTFWSESTFNYTPTAVEGGGNAIGSSGVISVPVEAGDEFEIFMTIKDVSFISGGVDEAGMQVYINFVNPLVSSAPTYSRFRYQAIVDTAGVAKYQSDFEKSVIVDWLPAGTANIWVSLQWGVNSHYPYSENDITGNIYLRITRIRR